MTADRCWAPGAYVNWPNTPAGREIARFTPSASDVVSTAQEMVDLATDMKTAATTLQAVAESDDGQQGKAVEKLRDTVDDSWEILRTAGEMYYETAAAIRAYGVRMEGGIAEAVNGAYILADQAWGDYETLPGDRDGAQTASADDDDPNAADDASENQDKYQAFQAWMNAANHWDEQYDDWETAWNDAIDRIEDAHDEGIEDGWTDILKYAYIVLTVIAVIAGIVAFFVTAPLAVLIAGAIAAVAGVLVAVVSIVRFARGDTDSVTTLVLDIVCAIPGIGPIAKLISKLGPAGMRVGIGAANLAGDFIPGALRIGANGMPYRSFAFAEGVSDMIIRGSAGFGAALDLPQFARFGDAFTDAFKGMELHLAMPGINTILDEGRNFVIDFFRD
ncbi:hypothetical protein [Microbacterium sp. gxy059]|uniref:hypothetical protein n=1 Tax=Microbacterium sp. gxy059 TaxID=2957199 RepID=UPI003D960112